MNVDDAVARACSLVPGLIRGALALLPEGLLIGGVGEASAFEQEPLVRSATRCLLAEEPPLTGDGPRGALVEFLFVNDEQLVVIQRGRSAARLALAVVCTREPNLAFVLSSSRRAMREIEGTIDLAVWEI
jgi:hypothetical protein